MLSNEHLKLLLQGVSIVLALHYAKGSMTGEYRNLMAVGLVAVVLIVVNRLFAEYEGMTAKCEEVGFHTASKCVKEHGLMDKVKECEKYDDLKEVEKCMGKDFKAANECKTKAKDAAAMCEYMG